MQKTPKIKTKVPMASQARFAGTLRIAGAVQNAARFNSGSAVIFQCGRNAIQTSIEPNIAPSICATK